MGFLLVRATFKKSYNSVKQLRDISVGRYIIYCLTVLTVPQILAFLATKGSRQQGAYQSLR